MSIELSFALIVVLALCAVVLLAVVGVGLFTFLVKIGVIIKQAQRPPHIDKGNYRLDQGREVRAEDDRHDR